MLGIKHWLGIKVAPTKPGSIFQEKLYCGVCVCVPDASYKFIQNSLDFTCLFWSLILASATTVVVKSTWTFELIRAAATSYQLLILFLHLILFIYFLLSGNFPLRWDIKEPRSAVEIIICKASLYPLRDKSEWMNSPPLYLQKLNIVLKLNCTEKLNIRGCFIPDGATLNNS